MGRAKANHKRNERVKKAKIATAERTMALAKYKAAEAKKDRKAEARARHAKGR
ncbi:MAG: hypothetical protein LUC93_00650 [Planctomycetaceae bacterium]|nr:hypothetical protein [Planctomycetaceae bacterium]